MGRVLVVTDSSANVPAGLAQELGICVVPILLNLNGQTYRDGIDITPGEVYRLLRARKRLPTTAAPSAGDFLRVYAAAAQDVSGIVSIHLPTELSATFSVASTSRELVDGPPIRIVDSQSVAMGQGFVVLEAARAAAAGADLDAVVARAEQVGRKMHVYATLGTLEYLRRGGRIGGAAALAGTMLRIKPMVYVAGGTVNPFAKPRTMSRAVQLMLDEMARRAGDGALHAAVLHADAPDEAEELRQRVESAFDCVELHVTEFTPVMGVHAGPGVLGLAFFAE
ncbi:MAG: DegV family EDD domain-containing protein [Anaerolineae bacterium]|nr:DegV family EDD domain-containing protein [Anaerolineae bacterium]